MSNFPFNSARLGKYLDTIINVNELRDYPTTKVKDGDIVAMTARVEVGDGEGAIYRWVEGALDDDDGVKFIQPSDSVEGRWVQAIGAIPGPRGEGIERLAGNLGATLIGFGSRTVDDALKESPSVTSYGAKTAVNPSIFNNAPTFQTAIDANGAYAGNIGRAVHIPQGLWPIAASVTPSDYSTIRGDGPRLSIFYNEQAPLNMPAIRKDAAQTGFWRIEDVGFRGYNTGVYVAGPTDGLRFSRLHMLKCNYGFNFAGMLQTTVFDDIEFEQCDIGIFSQTNVANRVTVNNCDFKNMTDSAIILKGAEDFHIENSRFEGGGVANKSTLDFSNIRVAKITGGYFESTHQYLMRLVASPGGVVIFDGVHFTGTGVNDGLGYQWLTDGTGTIIFRNCHATYPMRVPSNSIFEGPNPGLRATSARGRFTIDAFTPTTQSTNIISIVRDNITNDPTNLTTLTGTFKLTANYSSADGGVFGSASRIYSFSVNARAGNNIMTDFANSYIYNTGSGANVVLNSVSSPNAVTFSVSLNGITPSSLAVCKITASIEWDQESTIAGNNFEIKVA